jgi:hypothetical protein
MRARFPTDLKRLERTRADLRKGIAAGRRDMPSLVDTEEVTGSIPARPHMDCQGTVFP